MELTDEEAVSRTLAGEPEAFGLLVRRYQGSIYRYLVRLTGSPQDAEDLAQEVFLHAYRQLPRLRAAGAFRSWLYRSARNRAIDHARGPSRPRPYNPVGLRGAGQAEAGQVGAACGGDDPELEAIRREEVAALGQAVRVLPLLYREVIHLKYVEELTVGDIAEVLRVSPRTVETRLYRARQRLRGLLEGMGWHEDAVREDEIPGGRPAEVGTSGASGTLP